MARTVKDVPFDVRPVPLWATPFARQDRQHMRAERRRQRRRDNHLIRTTREWDEYTNPRHPFDPYGLPSW